MGYMRHHAIVVTGRDENIQTARAKAIELGAQVSDVVLSAINGYGTILIAPDGSKESWVESDYGDSRRDVFVAWLEQSRFNDGSSPMEWVEVQYGDDEGETLIVRASDRIALRQ